MDRLQGEITTEFAVFLLFLASPLQTSPVHILAFADSNYLLSKQYASRL
jgi:hypothetical protein